MEAITPRTNASFLSQHTGRTVILVGRVTSPAMSGGALTVDSSGSVSVALPQHAPQLAQGTFVHVVGRVAPDLAIKALTALDLGGAYSEY